MVRKCCWPGLRRFENSKMVVDDQKHRLLETMTQILTLESSYYSNDLQLNDQMLSKQSASCLCCSIVPVAMLFFHPPPFIIFLHLFSFTNIFIHILPLSVYISFSPPPPFLYSCSICPSFSLSLALFRFHFSLFSLFSSPSSSGLMVRKAGL